MTLRIHAPNSIRVGETKNVLVTSENPGVVSLSYGAGLTGPATVTIEGTRVYGNMGSGGDYVARVGAEGNARMDRTWLLRVDWNAVQCGNNATAGAYIAYPILASMRMESTNRLNWFLFASVYNANGSAPNRSIRLALSQNSGTNPVVAVGTLVAGDLALAGVRRYAVTITGTTVAIYTDARATVANNTVSGIIGTMGGSEALVWQSGVECSKIARVASSAELDAWFSAGTIPATDREFVFSGGHEIDPAAPVIWDLSGNVTPLDLTAARITNWQAPGMSVAFADDPLNPVVPYAIVPVTAIATTGTTIDATRPRQGVPSRASEAARIETAEQVTVTVEAPLVSIGPDTSATVSAYPATIPLQVCASPDGTVSLESDDANLTVPAAVVISGGSATVSATASADVTGATVTATYGATTDTAAVTVSLVPETLDIGPDTSIVVDAYPATVKLLVASNTDGSVAITSNNAALVPTSPVTVSGGQAEVTCTVSANVTGATVTASRTGLSDACSVTVTEVVTALKIGPSQTLRAGVTSIYLHITGEDGACTVTSSPTVGLSGLPATVTISGGEADLTLTKMSAGTYTITVTRGLLTDTCTVVVPVSFVSSDEYDLVADVAAMIEGAGVASGNGYHYDDELLGEDGGDDEDRMFSLQETGIVNGPFANGKTVMLRLEVHYSGRAPSSDARNLMDYLNCQADPPSYVHALLCGAGATVNELGADRLIYEIQVSLG